MEALLAGDRLDGAVEDDVGECCSVCVCYLFVRDG